MSRDSFPSGVAAKLGWYVYRLVDPRNGETFYVGKGRGDRIFAHSQGALSTTADEDSSDLKYQRIKEILAIGLEVGHIVHRHGISTSKIAYEVEAALIDAYPGLTNRAGGHGSGDYGSQHVEEIIMAYEAEPFQVGEPLILISIGRLFNREEFSVYEAVRAVWKLDRNRAAKYNLVLARHQALVVGAYRPDKWLEATSDNFPRLESDEPGRWGFEGSRAGDVWDDYVGKRVPDKFLVQGAANPIRYVDRDLSYEN